ncbi:MAG: TIR domain-containing protein, partial [Planctomycetota bacterium]
MARFVPIAHYSADREQVNGFRLLRWNINVNFTFFDRSLLSRVDSEDEAYIRRCIRDEMHGTSVTVVLIGNKTHISKWVRWEIEESDDQNNGLLGIKLKGKSTAITPSLLREYDAEILTWQPEKFKDAIELTCP